MIRLRYYLTGNSGISEKLLMVVMVYFLWAVSNIVLANDKWARDSTRIVRKIERNWPVETKGDYKRFYKLYVDKERFERLIKDKDSVWIKSILQEDRLTGRELFDLTFNNMSGDDFNYALLYPINFIRIKCKDDEWYLSQFGIIFNASGKATKIFDHQARGYTLHDKPSGKKEGD